MLYMDKKKCQQWSRSRGLQLPKLVQPIADNGSVSQGETSVNRYSMQTQEDNAFDRILRMSGGNKEKRITFDDLAGAQFFKKYSCRRGKWHYV